jgi:hypothetical protein
MASAAGTKSFSKFENCRSRASATLAGGFAGACCAAETPIMQSKSQTGMNDLFMTLSL